MYDCSRLRKRRIDMGMTLEEVGEIVGISRSAVQKYEKGTIKNIYISTVEAFSKALRCSPAYLMGWSDELNDDENSKKELTPHIIEVLKAYEEHPEMQSAIDKLLGIEK